MTSFIALPRRVGIRFRSLRMLTVVPCVDDAEQSSCPRDALAERLTCVHRILQRMNVQRGSPLAVDDVQDLAQEVWLLAWSRVHEFRFEAKLESWAFRFCDLQFRNAVRRDRSQRAHRHASVDLSVVRAGDGSDVRDAERRLDSVLDGLSQEEREILWSKHRDELTFEGLARSIGRSVNTTKSRYYRAVARARALATAGD